MATEKLSLQESTLVVVKFRQNLKYQTLKLIFAVYSTYWKSILLDFLGDSTLRALQIKTA